MKWKIINVEHNGRKGLRGSPKPNAVLGYECTFDWRNIKQFKPLRLKLKHHPDYDWWDTTEMLELSAKFEDNNATLILETVNSIYYFELINLEDVEKLKEEMAETFRVVPIPFSNSYLAAMII